jgi:hypothetical protein
MKRYRAALAAVMAAPVIAAGMVGGTTQSAAGAAGDNFGSIQVVCRFSHTNSDDPIVSPLPARRRPPARFLR